MTPSPFRFKTCQSLSSINAADWDALVGQDHPFLSYAFLNALEISGCVGARSGWHVLHLLCYDDQSRLVGAAPCYIKSHSQGEYVFDQGWAQAYERAGGAYYPKLQVAVPFTPATGPRLLAKDHDHTIKLALAQALKSVCLQMELSSVHVTFPVATDHQLLCEQGWLERHDEQFHWVNEGYQTYDDF